MTCLFLQFAAAGVVLHFGAVELSLAPPSKLRKSRRQPRQGRREVEFVPGGKPLQKVALTQGAFYVASGVWPLIDVIYLADA